MEFGVSGRSRYASRPSPQPPNPNPEPPGISSTGGCRCLTNDDGAIWFDPMSRRTLVWLLVTSVCGSVGCFSPRRGGYQSSHPVSIAEPSEQADQLWEAVQDTLRRGRFQLDRIDRQDGVITTMPEASQHFFEFWRHDVNTSRDAWEATLNPMRRWVEVTLTKTDDGPWTQLAVVVHKERLSSPDRQFNSSGAAYQYFGDSLPSTTGPSRVTAKDDRWLDYGHDAAMEDYLLRKILTRCPAPVASTSEPATGS